MSNNTSNELTESVTPRVNSNITSNIRKVAIVPVNQLSAKSLVVLKPQHLDASFSKGPLQCELKSNFIHCTKDLSVINMADFREDHVKSCLSLKFLHASSSSEDEKKMDATLNPSYPSNHCEMTLVEYLSSLLTSRGYSTQHFAALDGGYFCKPTDFQKASYGLKLIQAVRRSDTSVVEKMLEKGISANPCNAFGESILHTICRRGDNELLKIFLKYGGCVQVCDDFGRTPLHDACWTSKVSTCVFPKNNST